MFSALRTLSTAFVVLLLNLPLDAQDLPRSNPEAEGVSSKAILDFVRATRTSKTELHSFMLVRHGKVVAEGWSNPYAPELRHSLYSCSKSFTATAVGFAMSERKLSLDDKVVSFFPDQLPPTVSPNLAKLTVEDALIMSDGQDPEPSYAAADTNWVKSFLAAPIVHEPGTKFLYNSIGTYMLSAIVQKVTGQSVLDYLKPRLFDPLGITGMDWETDIKGINTGGWGLRLKTEDMAKFAQLFLQNGRWNGKQVLPKGWTKEASTAKIIQHPDLTKAKRDSSDWEQGYGYQMWRCRNNAYRGDGAYGQYMIVMPDQDAALAVTAESKDMQEEINLVWKYLLPAMHQQTLPENQVGFADLKKELSEMALPPLKKQRLQGAEKLSGTYQLDANDLKLSYISFKLDENGTYEISMKSDTASYNLSFGAGTWLAGTTNKPGPSLTARARENRSVLYPAKVTGSYTWKDEHNLQLSLRYIESPHTENFICEFGDKGISIRQSNSFENGKEIVIRGRRI
jgi:CubicO group peptidase (beta-lactamase class C family)